MAHAQNADMLMKRMMKMPYEAETDNDYNPVTGSTSQEQAQELFLQQFKKLTIGR